MFQLVFFIKEWPNLKVRKLKVKCLIIGIIVTSDSYYYTYTYKLFN